MGRKLTIEEIKQRLFEVHGDEVTLDESTYVNTQTPARFIDKDYGSWWAKENHIVFRKQSHRNRRAKKIQKTVEKKYGVRCVFELDENKKKTEQSRDKARISIKEFWNNLKINQPEKIQEFNEKRKRTCLRIYGGISSSQDSGVALKAAKSSNNSYKLNHWKTNEELVCVGSYEKKAIEYLNQNKIDFDFQIRFDMPDKRKYFIDLYLKDQDLWIEVKGYFRKDAREKWDWFHSEYPNSELWDKQKLQQLGIL